MSVSMVSGLNILGKDYLSPGNSSSLRYTQKTYSSPLRSLTKEEISILVQNRNKADDWKNISVSDPFNPQLIQDSHFYGKIRIGELAQNTLVFHDLKSPCGIRNSTITCCDIGNNPVIDTVSMSYYITGDSVILINISEMHTTSHAKFGNGQVKEGEDENVRIDIGIGNENGNRSILLNNKLTSADAYLWYKYRDQTDLLESFKKWTDNPKGGYYGSIGSGCVLKCCSFIKDVNIGEGAYIKGVNKLKNLTIQSSLNSPTQIGEGVELVNGIIGYGCRIFYGVKAVRFMLKDHSQLKYGARLINSFLSENSTISCCEVLNSFIYPCHEQHHNNSFLIGATIMGQSNIAAGATIGSNHNSRGADGEILAARGFWPGLCVSLKHNSRFASFCLLSKGSYPAEIDLPLPFSLLSNDIKENRLIILPAYWFSYNMYALARNSWKFQARDKRKEKPVDLEFDYLAPDTINEMLKSLDLLEDWTSKEYDLSKDQSIDKLMTNPRLNLHPANIERTTRQTLIRHAGRAYQLYKKLIDFYLARTLMETDLLSSKNTTAATNGKNTKSTSCYSIEEMACYLYDQQTDNPPLIEWINAGGQLIRKKDISKIFSLVSNKAIDSWEDLHNHYLDLSSTYPQLKEEHAVQVFFVLIEKDLKKDTSKENKKIIDKSIIMQKWKEMLIESKKTRQFLLESALKSREKDFKDPFRCMMYDNLDEQKAVIGTFESDSFLIQEKKETQLFLKQVDFFLEE